MVSVACSPTYSREDWQKGYVSLKTESSYWIEDIEGQLPPDLVGTLFRNGPGNLERGGDRYGHPFDGDGTICAITFQAGLAHFRNRFVRTPEFVAEQKANRILYRSVFGTQKPGGWFNNLFDLKFKNPANTNVVIQGGKLLALWEADSPYRLDPISLDTRGQETFNGLLSRGQAFTAHPRVEPETGDLLAFGVDAGPISTIYFYRVDSRGELVETTARKIPGFSFLHDFAITPNYRIFFQNPVTFNPIPVALGLKPPATCIALDPKARTRILLFDRNGDLTTLEADPGFIFHHVNAFEEDRRIVVDSFYYDDFVSLEPGSDFLEVDFDAIPYASLCRYQLDLRSRTVVKELLVDGPCEFGTLHPSRVGRTYRYAYIGTGQDSGRNAPLQVVAKVNVETRQQERHSFAPRGFLGGDPVFVPRPGAVDEDDGWVLAMVFDAEQQRSDVVVLDARSIRASPVAVLHLKHHIPYGLHGTFTPETFVS
jgi:all-trans-8'-apo-beta-carotenal 15,15'-oxygenase